MKLNKSISTFRFNNFIDNVGKHEILNLAASLAYTTALALAPFVLILLSIASLLGSELQKKLFVQLSSSIGEKAGNAIMEIVNNAKDNSNLSGLSGFVGLTILAISASTIFIQLRLSLNKIDEYRENNSASAIWNFFKERFLSIGFVFGFIFLLILSFLVSTFIAMVYTAHSGLIWKLSSLVIDFLIFSFLFTAIYRFIPSSKMQNKRCKVSGVISAIFYLIGKNLVSFYIGRAGIESSYGAAGSLVAFLVWIYYITLTFLISYEFSNNIVSLKKD
jgi:membrane protein